MPKGTVKIKKKTLNDKDTSLLNDMFNQMMGVDNAAPEIIKPKLVKTLQLIKRFCRIYNLFLNFQELRHTLIDNNQSFVQIENFLKNIEQELNITNTTPDTTIDSFSNTNVNDLNVLYKKIKECQIIRKIIITSSKLSSYKKQLNNRDKLQEAFISREPGISYTPLAFCNSFDLKKIWSSDDITVLAKKYILNIISHTMEIGLKLYEIINSPDIDVEQFSLVLIKAIEKLKKQIPRCDKAFNSIKDSVNLLQNNFNNYYKESIEAENPSIIIENFIVDVSIGQKADAVATSQFRKIIMHLKQKSAGIQDPKMKQLFKLLNNNFQLKDDNIESDGISEDDVRVGIKPDKSEPPPDINQTNINKDILKA